MCNSCVRTFISVSIWSRSAQTHSSLYFQKEAGGEGKAAGVEEAGPVRWRWRGGKKKCEDLWENNVLANRARHYIY